jgi:hypothetical protein
LGNKGPIVYFAGELSAFLFGIMVNTIIKEPEYGLFPDHRIPDLDVNAWWFRKGDIQDCC